MELSSQETWNLQTMKMSNSKAELYSSDLIDKFLNEIPYEEYERTKNKILLASRIDDAIKAKGWKKKGLAKALNKQPSEISKWLSGTHNFTTDTLWDIEKILNIKLITLSDSQAEQVTNFVISVSQEKEKKSPSCLFLNDQGELITYLSTNYTHE